MTFILDASVAIKWFLPEVDSDKAQVLLEKEYVLLVPDLFFIEIDAILTKRVRKRALRATEAEEIAKTVRIKNMYVTQYSEINNVALSISTKYFISHYDAIYLALAVVKGEKMITADKRLANAVKNTPLKSYLKLLED